MQSFHNDLYITLKSVEHKLAGVENQLAALDNKFDSLEKKVLDILSRCLGSQPTPFDLLYDVDSSPVEEDVTFEQKVQLFNGGMSDSESEIDKKDQETSADSIQDDSDKFETISVPDGETEQAELNVLIEVQNFLSSLKCTNEENPKLMEKSNDLALSSSTSIMSEQPVNDKNSEKSDLSSCCSTEESANDETGKKPKKVLFASQVLELIGNFIQVTDRQGYIQHYNAVIKFFINELKIDETFYNIFKGEVMAGSYRDGLKISKPNEFDTIMRLSFGDKSNLLVERISGEPAHCTIKLIGYDANAKPYLKQFLDPEGYLLQDVIIIWLQKLFRKIIQPYNDNNKIIEIGNYSYQYTHSINGPAFTFKITVLGTPIKFDMDLVPAIPFDFTHWVATRDYSKESNQINWIAVPKPPKGGVRRNNRSFICSYTEMEKHILHDVNQAKNLIRIFKKLRDKQELTYLKSYFIKTIFLWQFNNTTIQERKLFWSRSLEVIFVDMFKIILNHIQRRELKFYWEPSYNMFKSIAETKLKSWDDKLRGINSRLQTIIADNPKGLIDIILTPEERKQLECKHAAKLCP